MKALTEDFPACDTSWRVSASGRCAREGVAAARATVLALESRLNGFAPGSAVARLNRDGRVEDAHVARLVTRAIAYRERTGGAFDVARGAYEHALKDYLRGGDAPVRTPGPRASYRVRGDVVEASAPLDLNGIAKGYIVDQAHAALVTVRAEGFVDGGGDIASPTGPVAIASPHDPDATLGVLDTRWNVATSGTTKRRRGSLSHLYDPRDPSRRAPHDQVTVLAARDCTEADVLATTLAILPLREGFALAEAWPGVEALWVEKDRMYATEGFHHHVVQA